MRRFSLIDYSNSHEKVKEQERVERGEFKQRKDRRNTHALPSMEKFAIEDVFSSMLDKKPSMKYSLLLIS